MKKFTPFPILLALLVLSGCNFPVHDMPVDKLSDVPKGQVIIVGRVEITPPLTKEEQVQGLTAGMIKNKVFLNLTPKLVDEPSAPDVGPEYMEGTMGKFFFVRRKADSAYLQDMSFYISAGEDGAETVKLPGRLKINIRKGDRAVYIGTMRYSRNEYFDITSARLVNEYRAANAAFKRKFGAHYNLRNAEATPVK